MHEDNGRPPIGDLSGRPGRWWSDEELAAHDREVAAKALRDFEKALVAATQAQVHATLALVEQQRIVAKLTVALVEQIGALAQTQAQPGYPSDPMLAVFEYLTDDERKGLGL